MKEYKFADPFGLFGNEKPIFMAHRGYTPIAPENSIVSFEAAAERGYWAIETDVHETLDGVLVCCHNFSLSKMYGVKMKIEEHNFAELQSLQIVTGNNVEKYTKEELRLPLFDEYLEICKKSGCVPFIETLGSDPDIMRSLHSALAEFPAESVTVYVAVTLPLTEMSSANFTE